LVENMADVVTNLENLKKMKVNYAPRFGSAKTRYCSSNIRVCIGG
jgi:hypothetical protein